MLQRFQITYNKVALSLFGGVLLLFFFSLPRILFEKPTSTILYASDGQLLSAVIATDGQWRFPARDSVPDKFKSALIAFEDDHFYEHNGVYLPAVVRAIIQNIQQKKVVSGASTLTMQVIRLSRDNPPRSGYEKALEMIRALRLEYRYNKEEILALYASNAPYGGNVVGIDAAAWRYFGRLPEQLSWAESATLAVLPNAPSLIFPGKNQEKLLNKRNRLLQKLFEQHIIDEETLLLALVEPLPQKPFALPQEAQHLLHTASKEFGVGQRFKTTIDKQLQASVQDIFSLHQPSLSANHVYNAAAIVIEVKTGKVIAYVGNMDDPNDAHSNMVDIIQAPRSTGSILKPFLYTAMLSDGMILPNTLIPDVPVQYDGFSPMNYTETFDGVVPASMALSRSLNIPSVIMLKDYSYARFYHLLQKLEFKHINRSADHYGLSIILGGAESSLWDVSKAYARMSKTLYDYKHSNGKYYSYDKNYLHYLQNESDEGTRQEEYFPIFDAGSIWSTCNSLIKVNRPDAEIGWELYGSSRPIAWKTGTSFGNRDAWAVGTTPEYVVGVWVGNADGQGRPDLTGLTAAAPILFDIFKLIPSRTWFTPPFDNLEKIAVCTQSGMRAGNNCTHQDTMAVPIAGLKTLTCTYHITIHLNQKGERVNSDCADPSEISNTPWFILSPVEEYYYLKKHPEHQKLPAFASSCQPNDHSAIGLIYPKFKTAIYIPKNFEGKKEKTVFEATHRDPSATLYWHLGNEFLGETKVFHQMPVYALPGKYKLVIIDQNGQALEQYVEFIEK